MTPAETKLDVLVRFQVSKLRDYLRDVRVGEPGAVDLALGHITRINDTLLDALDEAISATPEDPR